MLIPMFFQYDSSSLFISSLAPIRNSPLSSLTFFAPSYQGSTYTIISGKVAFSHDFRCSLTTGFAVVMVGGIAKGGESFGRIF